ncbi:MAG: AbrB/MazE/SpoVT family DNA-binding domain-containing protein [Alphaproteobacteria bacterium]|jgi:putative addiction module antidote
MNKPLTVRKWGGSCGVTLPRSILDELGVGEGDLLYAVSTPNGVELTPYDPDFAEVMDDAADYMRRHGNAMRKLAE